MTDPGFLLPPLAERLASVRSRIEDSARGAGRAPDEITTIVVTKFHPARLVRELYELGERHFGESRHQEAESKVAEVSDLVVIWHFIGQLQSKKARHVREYSDVIHAVDRESLIAALGGFGRPVEVFLQVNLSEDPLRGGAQPDDVMAFAERIETTPGLTLCGLMTVAPLGVEPRRAFERVRLLSDRVVSSFPRASFLSMGMSGDFEDAVREGATHLRIGAAITGNRPMSG